MNKYHVALSFAGEDREYVEQVAAELRDHGVDVFYDRFEDEEIELWGKDLYSHLSDVYQNRAFYTVMFVSEPYSRKLWPTHERRAAQARAFMESREYILPATFDESVEIPGLLGTTGRINLKNLPPKDLATKIVKKLKQNGVELAANSPYNYSSEARADIDFGFSPKSPVGLILRDMKSYNWYTQNPAIDKIFNLDFHIITADECFVLGRNIYQCACGGANHAIEIVENLRGKLAPLPLEAAKHIINGMFYEMYFDKNGEFRELKLKSGRMEELFSIQKVDRFKDCIAFIRKALQPYRKKLVVLPSETPEKVAVRIDVKGKKSPTIVSVKLQGDEMLVNTIDETEGFNKIWKLTLRDFLLEHLKETLSTYWTVPLGQLAISTSKLMPPSIRYRLAKDKTIGNPSGE